MGQFMQGNTDQQIRIDIGRKGGAAIVRRGVVGAQDAPELQLGVPDGHLGLPLDR
jgi:hypothetical protein